jgi:hypothetical protein
VDVSTTGGLDQAASHLMDPAIVSYGTADTAIISGSPNVRLEDRKVLPTDTDPENHGGKQQYPKRIAHHGKPGIPTKNQQNQSTISAIRRAKRMSLGLSSVGGQEQSDNDVYLSAEEENPAFEDEAMSSVPVPGFETREQRMYSFKVADGIRISTSEAKVTMPRTTALENIRAEVPASDVQDRNDGVAEPEPKTALDHKEQAFDSTNGGDLIDFSSKQEAAEAHVIGAVDGFAPTDGSTSNDSNAESSSPEAKAEGEEVSASDVHNDGAKTDCLDTSSPAAIDGQKMAITLNHEGRPLDPARPGDLDNVSAHAASPSTTFMEASDDNVSTENLPSNGIDNGVSSTEQKEESSGSITSDVQNGDKEDQVKESVAASSAPETSLNDTPREKYYFYQSSPTFFLELDLSLSPEERKKLEMQLTIWSPLSRIRTAEDILEILQRGSIFRNFAELESFLKLRYSEIVGVVITLPFAEALRYVLRDLYVTREEDSEVRQILQEDAAGNHVPAWRLFQGLMLEESRAAFAASWSSGDASTIQCG